ncbi:hypothetical protein T492DRAFT_873162 [Pavlovales sp. CCMP2436]|nr:hypothetical protein T492DRAFT_873162 [Pavlovales sp. CCMP2436]
MARTHASEAAQAARQSAGAAAGRKPRARTPTPAESAPPPKRRAAGVGIDEPGAAAAFVDTTARPARASAGRAHGSGRAGGDGADGDRVRALAATLREAYLDELECGRKAHPVTAPVSKQANCSRNPNCFVYPKSRALWAKAPASIHLAVVGASTPQRLLLHVDPPLRQGAAGLSNLGSTCYMNALLQLSAPPILYTRHLCEAATLYAHADFREAVFRCHTPVEEAARDGCALAQLQAVGAY